MNIDWANLIPLACIAAGVYLLFGQTAFGWCSLIMGVLMFAANLYGNARNK